MSESESAAAPSAAAEAARARREARKAKILGRGGDRLAQITKTGRGAEAEALYSSDPLPGAGSTGSSSPAFQASSAAKAAREATDDPDDVDIAHLPTISSQHGSSSFPDQDMHALMQRMSAAGGATPPGFDTQAGAGPQDPLQQMMMAMQSQFGGAGGEGGQMPQLPFDLGALLGGAGGDGTGGPGAGGMSGLFGPQGRVTAAPRGKLDKLFDFLHLFAMAALAFITVSAVFSRSATEASVINTAPDAVLADEHAAIKRWARLGYERPGEWEAHLFKIPDHMPFQEIVSA